MYIFFKVYYFILGLTVRTKWKSLRDKFRTILTNQLNSGDSTSVYMKNKSWEYYNKLQFLKDQFIPNQNVENISKGTEISTDSDDNTTYVKEENNIETESVSICSFDLTVSESYSPNINRADSSGYEIIPTEHVLVQNGKRKHSEEENKIEFNEDKYFKKYKNNIDDNDDLNFFKSLVPHVRNMSSSQKILYRMKILEVTNTFINSS